MMKGGRDNLVHMKDALKRRAVGQDHAVASISNAVRISRKTEGAQSTRSVIPLQRLVEASPPLSLLLPLLPFDLRDPEGVILVLVNVQLSSSLTNLGKHTGRATYPTSACWKADIKVVSPLHHLRLAYRCSIPSPVTRSLSYSPSLSTPHHTPTHLFAPQNTIICLTSNLGSDILAHPTASDASGIITSEGQSLIMDRTTKYFAPKLPNGRDSIFIFNKLAHESILKIGYLEVCGVRRVVRMYVLFLLAQKLSRGTIRGDRDGDAAAIAVSSGGESLRIKDNHPSDPSIRSSLLSHPWTTIPRGEERRTPKAARSIYLPIRKGRRHQPEW
ncbi:hypothetical protein BJ138DRAFT_1106681 [Hygrophoropsis aurantiaca]|uniref:Uncharacterized protein n=1 Tax=Hygrophoropsis aurantiaca TaxID=72124 RepID=A0ACB7ZV52_9AGAM|nr:hypothetical protein BJ138DRAFT_1106681 [Hygrophoropsis aurantiaca]